MNSRDNGLNSTPLLCFSHLRWNFVFQRPQHVLSRLAAHHDVYFIEEPVFEDGASGEYRVEVPAPGVTVLTPVLPHGTAPQDAIAAQRRLLETYVRANALYDAVLWYYTPMALAFSDGIPSSLCVYDCMDELSLFSGAPPELLRKEEELLRRADVVFTGGRSLYHAKRKRHKNVHCFPSAVDAAHFRPDNRPEPADMREIHGRRLGFYGVIDERFDIALIDELSILLPREQLVLIGPVVKIDPATLPRRANIHYLGQKTYEQLPAYLEHWDIAILPFALNDATRFISPTKTLEYLAAYKPVISTPIADVVEPYGTSGTVAIAENAVEFAQTARQMLNLRLSPSWKEHVDGLLESNSWQAVVTGMRRAMQTAAGVQERGELVG